ncbi:MAG: hypothetical protein E7773_00915 [Sphingomonas sp.]|uniref:hypothetical protein n=1 Tax=Sphingomonas sp. TaxID=28214 RepID=UPI0011FF5E97|nr:hypothetical protein [Sphingomonas sp.]THD38344.1 MAG: hypothetical protein E7773_00915 [Sphingomonas sp.]
MTGLEARALEIAERAEQRTLTRVAAQLAAELPDLGVAIEGDTIAIVGHGVLDDARLIWIGSLLK